MTLACLACGEVIHKGRKFNGRKEQSGEHYLNIPIYRFYIKCTRCSAEITFKTDPKNMDYECERGAKRNFEAWRNKDNKIETDEERLDRLEREEAELDAMGNLEAKVVDARTDMKIADALDDIRERNARNERAFRQAGGDVVTGSSALDAEEDARLQRERLEMEDEMAAKRAFERARAVPSPEEKKHKEDKLSWALGDYNDDEDDGERDYVVQDEGLAETKAAENQPVAFKKGLKRKKDFGASLGIKKKAGLI